MQKSARDILTNNVREKLAKNEVVSSLTVRLCRGIEIARIAKTAGFDSIYVDMEHSSLSLDTTGQICLAAMQIGIAPFVRVPANSPEWISRVLDAGALGVIAPHISSAQEARAVVAAAKFAPLGNRSAAGGMPHLEYRAFPAHEAYPVLNDATMVIVQFEDVAGLEHADENRSDVTDFAFFSRRKHAGDVAIECVDDRFVQRHPVGDVGARKSVDGAREAREGFS